MHVELRTFNPKIGLDRGRPFLIEAIWYLVKLLFFLSAFPWPTKIKRLLLIIFGAKIGKQFVIKPRVNIHFPWKLECGDNVWLGEEVFILNFEKLSVGNNVCISQRAFLCGGNHDYRDPAFAYRNGTIIIQNGAWIGASVFVSPNIVIGENCVVTAGSIVNKNLPANVVCSGNPCEVKKDRWKKK